MHCVIISYITTIYIITRTDNIFSIRVFYYTMKCWNNANCGNYCTNKISRKVTPWCIPCHRFVKFSGLLNSGKCHYCIRLGNTECAFPTSDVPHVIPIYYETTNQTPVGHPQALKESIVPSQCSHFNQYSSKYVSVQVQVPEQMPEQILEQMPEQILKQISEQIPEQLPKHEQMASTEEWNQQTYPYNLDYCTQMCLFQALPETKFSERTPLKESVMLGEINYSPEYINTYRGYEHTSYRDPQPLYIHHEHLDTPLYNRWSTSLPTSLPTSISASYIDETLLQKRPNIPCRNGYNCENPYCIYDH